MFKSVIIIIAFLVGTLQVPEDLKKQLDEIKTQCKEDRAYIKGQGK